MKSSQRLLVLIVTLTITIYVGCQPGISVKNQKRLSVAQAEVLKNKLTCFFYATCPPNPAMGAPCYEYNNADTAVFGSGKIYIQIGTNNFIYRTITGNFNSTPFSYIYSASVDSLAFNVINDSLLIIHLNSQYNDSVKISTINDSVLTLKYISAQFGNTIEIDSLKR